MKHFRRIMYAVAFALCLVLFGCNKSNPTTTKKTTKTTPTESKTTSKVTKKGNYILTTNNDYIFAGSVDQIVNPDGTVTIVSKANAPFVFEGLYEGDVKLSGDSSYTVTINRNYNIDVKWECTDSTIAYLPSHFTNGAVEKSISGVTISNVTKVFIPKGITNIDYNSFANCTTLESVYIPTSVKYFGQNAFEGCNPLKVYYDGSIYDWLKIAFNNGSGNPMATCGSFYYKTYSESGTETSFGWEYDQIKDIYEIPSNVYELNYCGFAGFVELESLVIPTSVTKIGYGFLWKSGVETIYYGGASDEWDNIQTDGLGKTVSIIPYSETEKSGSWHYVNNVPVMWGDEPTCYTLTTTNSDTSAGTCTIYTNQSFVAGTPVTLTATPNEGYVFEGWYFGENKEYKIENSDTEEFSLLIVTDLELTAKWTAQSSPTYYTVTTTNDDETGGTCTIYTNKQFAAGDDVALRATPADGYVFIGWYDGDTKVDESVYYIIYGINKNYNLTAKWALQSTTNYYLLTVTNENRNYGSCAIYTNQQFEAGTLVILNATPEDGYAFDGWYDGETKVSDDPNYTFRINSNLTLVGKWIEAPVGQYVLTTINSYTNAGSITAYTNKQFDKGSSVTLTATINTGYAFDGWYNGTTRVCNGTTYTFIINSNLTLTAKWFIKVSTTTNYSSAGTYTKYTDELFSPNESIELTESTSISAGYTFEGWYNGTTLLSDEETYNHIVTAPITIEARWTYYTLTIMPCYNSSNDIPDNSDYYNIAGLVSVLNNSKITAGQKLIISVQPKTECVTWLGWYEKDGTTFTFLSKLYNYEYEMPKANKYIVAKFLLYKETSTNVIQFGYYPQTVVDWTDSNNTSLLTELYSKYTDLPTPTELNGWTDYGYYDDGAVDSYMWYLDVDLDNDKINDYRGVYFTKYRPNKTSIEATSGNSEAYKAEYNTGIVYWFKYDPVLWDVVADGGAGDKVLVSRLVLDAQSYYNNTDNREGSSGTTIYPNNYVESTIKAWLKENFMYTTFDLYRRSVLCINLTDNSAASTGNTTNQYALDGEFADYVYLMSYKEAQTYIDGKTYEQATATDYAKVQGVVMGTGSSSDYAITWLRSPASGNKNNAKYISSSGLGNNAGPVTSNYGVRPVVNLIP